MCVKVCVLPPRIITQLQQSSPVNSPLRLVCPSWISAWLRNLTKKSLLTTASNKSVNVLDDEESLYILNYIITEQHFYQRIKEIKTRTGNRMYIYIYIYLPCYVAYKRVFMCMCGGVYMYICIYRDESYING